MESCESDSLPLHQEQPTPSEPSLFEKDIPTRSIDQDFYQRDSSFPGQEKYPLPEQSLFEKEIPSPGRF